MKKQINKTIKNTIITIIILAIVILTINTYKVTNKIELTQLTNNSYSQMMGYIIKTKRNQVIVIDGGIPQDAENLTNHIQKLGGKIDHWFITHPHQDHAGAFIQIVQENKIEIENIYYTANEISWYEQNANERAHEAINFYNVINGENIKNKIHDVKLNEQITIDNVECEILGIKNPEITENAFNNSSMVIKMNINDESILFLADTGKESSEKLIKTQKEKLKANIVQVAHHGQNGATQELYKIISPKICLWPTPEWLWENNLNNQGEDTGPWKTKETRKWMEELNVEKNIIEKDGDITIEIY